MFRKCSFSVFPRAAQALQVCRMQAAQTLQVCRMWAAQTLQVCRMRAARWTSLN